MTSNSQFDNKTTGTEVAAAFGDEIRGKNGEFDSIQGEIVLLIDFDDL